MNNNHQSPSAFFMTDSARGTTPAHVATLPDNTGVIFRDYDHKNRTELGRAYKQACQDRGLVFLVAGDAKLAETLAADGLHMPEHMFIQFPPARHEHWMISAACHSKETVLKAAQYGADLAILSPIFPTLSHPDAHPLGLKGLTHTLDASPIPIYALGGIDQNTMAQLPDHPRLAGVAAIGMFLR